jgi:hypothetical protein
MDMSRIDFLALIDRYLRGSVAFDDVALRATTCFQSDLDYALRQAVLVENVELVHLLLRANADPDRGLTEPCLIISGNCINNCLHQAAITDNVEIFNALQEAGASLKPHADQTVYMIIAKNCHENKTELGKYMMDVMDRTDNDGQIEVICCFSSMNLLKNEHVNTIIEVIHKNIYRARELTKILASNELITNTLEADIFGIVKKCLDSETQYSVMETYVKSVSPSYEIGERNDHESGNHFVDIMRNFNWTLEMQCEMINVITSKNMITNGIVKYVVSNIPWDIYKKYGSTRIKLFTDLDYRYMHQMIKSKYLSTESRILLVDYGVGLHPNDFESFVKTPEVIDRTLSLHPGAVADAIDNENFVKITNAIMKMNDYWFVRAVGHIFTCDAVIKKLPLYPQTRTEFILERMVIHCHENPIAFSNMFSMCANQSANGDLFIERFQQYCSKNRYTDVAKILWDAYTCFNWDCTILHDNRSDAAKRVHNEWLTTIRKCVNLIKKDSDDGDDSDDSVDSDDSDDSDSDSDDEYYQGSHLSYRERQELREERRRELEKQRDKELKKKWDQQKRDADLVNSLDKYGDLFKIINDDMPFERLYDRTHPMKPWESSVERNYLPGISNTFQRHCFLFLPPTIRNVVRTIMILRQSDNLASIIPIELWDYIFWFATPKIGFVYRVRTPGYMYSSNTFKPLYPF